MSGKLSLQESDTKLFAYGSNSPLPVRDMCKTVVEAGNGCAATEMKMYVVEGAKGNLLSYDTACKLNIMDHVNAVHEHPLAHVVTSNKSDNDTQSRVGLQGSKVDQSRAEAILKSYPTVLAGLGKLKDFQLKLNIDNSIAPVYQKHRRVPFLTRPKVEKAIKQLYEGDICEDPVNTPTPWISPTVVVPKPKDPDHVSACVDMRAANQVILRTKYPMPTIHELTHDLNGCRVFSKIDLRQGYHQIELHPDSRYITTFSSHLCLH